MSRTDLAVVIADVLHFGDPEEKIAIICTVIRALADDDDLSAQFTAQLGRDPDMLQAWQLAAALDRLDQFRIPGAARR